LFATKFPPIERAGVGGRNERNRSYADLEDAELDDAFASHRGRKQKPPPRQEEKPAAKSEPNYDAILAWFVEGHKIILSDEQPFAAYFAELKRVPKLQETAEKYVQTSNDRELAFWMEMVRISIRRSPSRR